MFICNNCSDVVLNVKVAAIASKNFQGIYFPLCRFIFCQLFNITNSDVFFGSTTKIDSIWGSVSNYCYVRIRSCILFPSIDEFGAARYWD